MCVPVLSASPDAPYFVFGEKKIFTIFDPPHLLKCLRNNLFKHNVALTILINSQERKGSANWRYIQEAYDHDQRQPLLNHLDKITTRHLNPRGYLSRRVSISAQTLSHSVAATISCLVTNGELL
jgi:hypothetical protein